jgi:thiol-disulfide isomerase/thioredoxin
MLSSCYQNQTKDTNANYCGHLQASKCSSSLPKDPLTKMKPDVNSRINASIQENALSIYQSSWLWVQFWATDCPSCITEMRDLSINQKKFSSRGLKTIGIAMQHDTIPDLQKYLEQNPVDFDIFYDHTGLLGKKGFGEKIFVTPTSVLLNPEGKAVYRLFGPQDFTKVVDALDQILPK